MNRTESVYQQDGLSSIVDTSDKLKLGEFFYLRRNNRYSLICVHCYDEFEHFTDFTLHIEQHLLRWGIQSVKPMKMENTQGTAPLPLPHTGYAGNENLALFKNEFGHGNTGEIPQYFYNGYNPSNWFPDGQPINSNQVPPRKPVQFDDEFQALKRQFNEPMFIINDSPEVRQLSQYLAESYPIEKRSGQYKCPLCEKLFNGSALARRHVFTHSVDKVFSCAGCQRKFSHARNEQKHTFYCFLIVKLNSKIQFQVTCATIYAASMEIQQTYLNVQSQIAHQPQQQQQRRQQPQTAHMKCRMYRTLETIL